ncbi:YceI family protein [Stackebrandtia nassauensis]|uniref:YceI family protein n=1 Tax=Stackebrandtia nassauensis (strain DSM 44728 / CIP 108903 / NRRL B-16338 / NBRC 102104 / LLR-40K-21) TaxID=446470 RepID=D3Q4W1_STANL|nr:YceI family protein [Stackebrandtia nassauensis]ADD42141.1 YceI family protein [Stackebrandtia nassauensis DSM 44728]
MNTTAIDPTLSGTYVVDPTHSRFGFVARHAMVTKVRGSFPEFEATGFLNTDDPTSSTAEVTLQVASVDTGNEQRDGHLRTNDFFDAPNHPQITFRSTSVEDRGDNEYRLNGDLTIKGVTKPISVDLEYTGTALDPYGNRRIGLEGTATLNRRDFGVNFQAALETGGVLVSDKINLEFDISAIQQKPE